MRQTSLGINICSLVESSPNTQLSFYIIWGFQSAHHSITFMHTLTTPTLHLTIKSNNAYCGTKIKIQLIFAEAFCLLLSISWHLSKLLKIARDISEATQIKSSLYVWGWVLVARGSNILFYFIHSSTSQTYISSFCFLGCMLSREWLGIIIVQKKFCWGFPEEYNS